MIISIDLDGTLLNDQGQLPSGSRQDLKKLSSDGWVIVLSTARPFFGILHILKELDCINYLICSQGSHVFKFEYDRFKCIFKSTIQYKISKHIWDGVISKDQEIWWLSEKGWFAKYQSSLVKAEEYLLKKPCIISKDCPIISAYKMVLIGSRKIRKEILLQCINEINTSESNNGAFLEITKKEIDKGNSFENFILEQNEKIVVAIGDSDNDLGMFTKVKISISVSTSSKKIQSFTNHTIKRDRNNGILNLYRDINTIIGF